MLHFGDWVAPDVPKMSQWQARSKYTATASLCNTSGTLAKIARILGKTEDAAKYKELSRKVADAYCSVLTDGNGKTKEEIWVWARITEKKFFSLSITPLLRPVVPEVNIRTIRASWSMQRVSCAGS